jgi:dihydroorotase-like cyclic amidohydrolase
VKAAGLPDGLFAAAGREVVEWRRPAGPILTGRPPADHPAGRRIVASVDTVISGGQVCTSREMYEADIAVKDGKIAAIGTPECLPRAEERIDARGKVILPGLWHPHCHFRDPGMTHKEDFESGHRCAAAGGITFTIDQTNTDPHPSTLERWNVKRRSAEAKCIVDYNHYAAALLPDEVANLAGTGTVGFKMFNTMHPRQVYPYMPDLAVTDHGLMHELYERIAPTGLPVAVHHDDSDWVRWMVERDYFKKGKTTAGDFHEAHHRGYMYGHGMVMGLAASLYMARLAGVSLYVLHVGVPDAYDMELINHARSLGQTVYTELEMNPFLVDGEKAKKYGPCVISWGKDPQVAWDWIRKGWVDVAVIEHAPHTMEEIEPGWKDMWGVPLGLLGAQEFLPLMLTHVNRGHLSLRDLVRITSENPSKIFGLHPRKGAIRIGSDADLVIVDMQKEQRFRKDMVLSRSGWTVHDGELLQGWPVRTLVRGATVMKDGEVVGRPGSGRFIPRPAAPRARSSRE